MCVLIISWAWAMKVNRNRTGGVSSGRMCSRCPHCKKCYISWHFLLFECNEISPFMYHKGTWWYYRRNFLKHQEILPYPIPPGFQEIFPYTIPPGTWVPENLMCRKFKISLGEKCQEMQLFFVVPLRFQGWVAIEVFLTGHDLRPEACGSSWCGRWLLPSSLPCRHTCWL